MRYFNFRPRKITLLVKEHVDILERALAEGRREVEISLDLGKTRTRVGIEKDHLLLPDGQSIGLSLLRKMKSGDVCMVEKNRVLKVAFFADGRYYRLLSVGANEAPTLEISGIHMHRIKEITPWNDAREKIKSLKIPRGGKILEVGTGLGYTAIWALNNGGEVLSIEKDPNVMKIAEVNPWSRELVDSRVKIILGDATEVVNELPKFSFDRIIHDSPRFALAGALYSKTFYKALFELLKPQGGLYHYVGDPGKWRRKKLMAGVSKRLKEVGFVNLQTRAAGLLAKRP